jgi:hypothetical protein
MCIKIYFGKDMRKDVKLRMRNIIAKPAPQYGNETWVLREEDRGSIEASEMRFLQPVQGVSLRDEM